MDAKLIKYSEVRMVAIERIFIDIFNDAAPQLPELRLARSNTYKKLIVNQLATKQLIYELEFN